MKTKKRFITKRHRTVTSILKAFLRDPSEIGGTWTDSNGLDHEDREVAGYIKENGFWGFTETFAKPPVIHYWTDKKRDEGTLLRFFAHELGHITGKPARGVVAEENRADEYMLVAEEALALARKVRR